MPDESWWVVLFVVRKIVGIASVSCKSLQGNGSLLCNQHITLNRLVLEINIKVVIVGSLSEVQRSAIAEATHELSSSGEYALSVAAVRGFMEDMGFFVKDCLVAMDSASRDPLLRLSVNAILGLVDGVSVIVAEQAEEKEVYLDAAHSVLHHQLVRILPRDFPKYLLCHQEPLDLTLSIEEIEDIGHQHKALCESYCHQNDVKSFIDSFDDSAAYWNARRGCHNTFHLLGRFVGGLANHFPRHIDREERLFGGKARK